MKAYKCKYINPHDIIDTTLSNISMIMPKECTFSSYSEEEFSQNFIYILSNLPEYTTVNFVNSKSEDLWLLFENTYVKIIQKEANKELILKWKSFSCHPKDIKLIDQSNTNHLSVVSWFLNFRFTFWNVKFLIQYVDLIFYSVPNFKLKFKIKLYRDQKNI